MRPYAIVESDAFKRLNFADPSGSHRYKLKSEKFFRTMSVPAADENICRVTFAVSSFVFSSRPKTTVRFRFRFRTEIIFSVFGELSLLSFSGESEKCISVGL
jgi:hypothetical protein